MKVREIIKPFIAGIAVVLIPVAICATTNFTADKNYEQVPQPSVGPAGPKWDTSFMTYAGGVVSDRTERYYTRGKDWIIIKDFPENIDSHSSEFQKISNVLWFK